MCEQNFRETCSWTKGARVRKKESVFVFVFFFKFRELLEQRNGDKAGCEIQRNI